MEILKLIRWKNLLMIALTQYLIKYAFFEPFGVNITLNLFGFSLLVLATLCIAAGGYVINDIYDVETDLINKPDQVIVGKTISEQAANNLFIAFNVIGVGIGFYLSHLVGKSAFFATFIIVSGLLYVYASYLKPMPLIGNLVISAMVALSIIIVGLFELIPAITPGNQETQLTFFTILWDYALFAFILNLLREMIKDIEDIDGDHKAGMNTLPIAIGRERAKKIAFAVSFIPLGGAIYYLINYLYGNMVAVVYFLVAIIAPMLYIVIKIFMAETKKEFHFISNMIKLVMLLGMLSLIIYKYSLLD
ncbi:geranylgeranylglycerol-phosphate geranylgeranyltransferase [Mangrovimonas sp. DI 80]|uniref:geranylgeranylglycerol-phosphate geranylgeranyltransferase n=1 Tax=Mangrovimonas sp. DI 80 TaxID=1779330 RepID=UPI000976C55C|nr:prenyltransferase [Mangrovimonas sp. DI 80]